MEEIFLNVSLTQSKSSPMKQIKIDLKSDFKDILEKIGSKLGVKAETLYTIDNKSINDITELKDNQQLYIYQKNELDSNLNPKEERKLIKVCMIGSSSAGKTCLLMRYVFNYYESDAVSTIENYYNKSILFNKQKVDLEITDTSGLAELKPMYNNWFKKNEGFIIVYAIDNRDTFTAIDDFYKELMAIRNNQPTPVVIVGTKLDKQKHRQVTVKEGSELAKKLKAGFYEASAKDKTNIEAIFKQIAESVYKLKYSMKKDERSGIDCCIF